MRYAPDMVETHIVNRLQLQNPPINNNNNSQFITRVHRSHDSFEIRMPTNFGMLHNA